MALTSLNNNASDVSSFGCLTVTAVTGLVVLFFCMLICMVFHE